MDAIVSTDAAILGVARVALRVRDLAGTEAFYRDVIGLQPAGGAEGCVRLGAGGAALLELQHAPDALPDDPASAGLFHTAFLLPHRADLARWLLHLRDRGVGVDGASDHGVSEAIYLMDPEGNGIEVYADRPRAEWRFSGGQVVMGTQRLDLAGLMRSAGAAPAWSGAPAGTTIGHVHLRVGDVAAAERFYAGELGLDVMARRPAALFMSSGGYHHHIAANTWHSAGAGVRDPARAGLAAVTLATSGEPPLARHDPWGTQILFEQA